MKIKKIEIEVDEPGDFEEVADFLKEFGLETSRIECEEKFDLSISGNHRITWVCPIL